MLAEHGDHGGKERDWSNWETALPVSPNVERSLPGIGNRLAVAEERGVVRAVAFQRDTVALAPFRVVPAEMLPLGEPGDRERRSVPVETRPRAGGAVLEGASVAPSFPPDPPPAASRR